MHLRIGLLVVVFFSTNIFSLQRSHSLDANIRIGEEKGAVKHRVIEGCVFVVPHNLLYRGYQEQQGLKNIVDAQGNPLTFLPQDLLVECWVSSVYSQNWAACGHVVLGNNFPVRLPLSLIDHKKEGEVISFFFQTDYHQIVKIELQCEQMGNRRYHKYRSFQDALNAQKVEFMRNPEWSYTDTERLIKDGILEKRITTFGTESYRHGQQGFYFDADAYYQEMKEAAGYDADDEMEFEEHENDGRCVVQ